MIVRTPPHTRVLAAVYINGAPVCQVMSRSGHYKARTIDLRTGKEHNAVDLERALFLEVTVRKFVGDLEIRLGEGVDIAQLSPMVAAFVRVAVGV